MNSLEFIEKEIERYESLISLIETMLKEERPDHEIKFLINDLKKYEEKIKHFQHLKTILEVWYICKQHAHINKYDKKRFDITIWLNTENCGFESCASYEDCLKVKQTLEVKDA